MSAMQARAPGAVGAVLNADCYAGVICDGHHVADAMIALALRARAHPDKTFLVSDAMATVAGPPQFTLYGQTITLQDGRLINAEGALTGAHLTMAKAVQRLVQCKAASVQTALRMATSIPAQCIGAEAKGRLLGRPADEVMLLGADLAYQGQLGAIV